IRRLAVGPLHRRGTPAAVADDARDAGKGAAGDARRRADQLDSIFCIVLHIGWETARRDLPSPPFRGEREGPSAERWEGEVGIGERSGIPHLTPTLSAPGGGEGAVLREADHAARTSIWIGPSARPWTN